MTNLPIPDFLGTAARVETAANLIQAAQDQLQTLRATMLVNGHAESNQIPGRDDDQQYGKRMQELTDGIARLMADNADIADDLAVEAVQRRRRVEAQIAKTHEQA